MDPYEQYMSGNHALATPGGGGGSFLPYVAPITSLLGTASSAYGSYLQSQQMDKQYEESIRQYNEEKARRDRQDAQALRQQSLQNSLSTGQYAANRSNDIQTPYVGYAKMLGL